MNTASIAPDLTLRNSWLHWWAVFTVCCAVPLVLLGAEVTSKHVGMVDQVPVRPPWYLFTLPFSELSHGYKIEHSHRLFGFLVGTCTILLALGLWWCTRHPLLRWLGWVALAVVSLQGVLGAGRVWLNVHAGPELALLHGCFAQLAFATLMSVAVMTSPAWLRELPASAGIAPRLRRLSLALLGLVYVQIFFGAVLRHFQNHVALQVAQRVHVLLAFVVLATALWLASNVWSLGSEHSAAKRWAWVLACLVGLQLLLGVEAWLGRFGSGIPLDLQQSSPPLDMVRSGHFVTGLLIFSTTVILSLFLHRGLVVTAPREEVA